LGSRVLGLVFWVEGLRFQGFAKRNNSEKRSFEKRGLNFEKRSFETF